MTNDLVDVRPEIDLLTRALRDAPTVLGGWREGINAMRRLVQSSLPAEVISALSGTDHELAEVQEALESAAAAVREFRSAMKGRAL